VVVVVVVVGSAVVVDTPKAPTKRGIVVVVAVALEGAIVVVTGLGDVPIGNCPAPGDADPEATVVVVAPTVVVVAGGSVVVVVVLVVVVVVVVVVLVVVVVAGGAVAGEEVGVTLPVHGNGVPQLNVGVFTPETVRAKLLESFKSDPEVTACRRSLVFATADSGPLGVKADVYRAVPFTK
jgi:hypothetical protein